jgi:hypothetical protein
LYPLQHHALTLIAHLDPQIDRYMTETADVKAEEEDAAEEEEDDDAAGSGSDAEQ